MFGIVSTKRLYFVELRRNFDYEIVGWSIARKNYYFNLFRDIFSKDLYNLRLGENGEIVVYKYVPLSIILNNVPKFITKRKLKKLLDSFVYNLQKNEQEEV